MYKERRHVQRYAFAATAEVEDSVCVCQARVADLSIAGAYLVLPDFFPQGASVLVKIRTKTAFFQCDATVAHSSPHGMGVKFREISPPFLIVLQEWLLEARRDSIVGQSPEQAASVKNDTTPEFKIPSTCPKCGDPFPFYIDNFDVIDVLRYPNCDALFECGRFVCYGEKSEQTN